MVWCVLLIISTNTAFTQDLLRTNSGEIKFVSNAPLEIIKAESNNCQGILNMDNSEFAFRIFIKTFDGFNSPLQKEHFYENYMEVTEFPEATFTGQIIENVVIPIDKAVEIRAKGNLSIHGITVERIIKVILEDADGGIQFNSTFEVPLSDHNILIPNIVKQKIADKINVTISGILE